jgi:hypothetical protein
MTVRLATAIRVATKFRDAMRRLLVYSFTNSNPPAVIDRGATAFGASCLSLALPSVSAAILFELSRASSAQSSAPDATHPRLTHALTEGSDLTGTEQR